MRVFSLISILFVTAFAIWWMTSANQSTEGKTMAEQRREYNEMINGAEEAADLLGQ